MGDEEDINFFATTNFRRKNVPFGIRRDDRRRHTYVIGKTGMGKSVMLENMAIQDIQKGHGVCFIDPHGEAVEKLLNHIPNHRVNDVVYFNPADTHYPIAFNILESVDPNYKHLVASGLMGVFTKIWAGVWSARMEYILGNTVLALLDSPGNTMLGIARMLVDKQYRKKIIDQIKDPVVKSFWVNEYANYNEKFRNEAIAPIQNKVGQFLSSSIIRNIVAQPKSTIDLREIMDNQKIFLINLSKGRVGEDNSSLLGAMLITKLQLAAMSRVDIPESDRKDFYLYVDEFQNFATESFATILSEARKYRLNLIMAHQYIGQLVTDQKNTMMRDAVFGNVGSMVVFRVGSADAEFLEIEFDPVFTMNDLINLPKYHVYVKLMIDGVTSNPFSASTLPPLSQPTNNADKVIKVSRERYGNERPEIEEKINRWLGQEFFRQSANEENQLGDLDAENFRFKTKVAQPAAIAEATVEKVNPPGSLKETPASESIWDKVVNQPKSNDDEEKIEKVIAPLVKKSANPASRAAEGQKQLQPGEKIKF
ncbi:MAG: type IV secretion system DNA-binding domain-containing protein [Candidatus Doudnabacteria bacterium]|nr:type IV secretion system DNA-binding domain-containing protein [Candidatus Doudnabacteria bacterium]